MASARIEAGEAQRPPRPLQIRLGQRCRWRARGRGCAIEQGSMRAPSKAAANPSLVAAGWT
ncbi:MAG TPA: hypothetical protein VGS62_01550 [Streptosporangiaceae bacterium]|nr:hypothetical protein [Streptosporangiaceae bacterium]